MFVVLACVTALLQVSVHGNPGATATCGSTWDVVSGRVGWPQWWSWDLAQPIGASGNRLARTVRCPAAVDARMWRSGGLLAAAVAALVAGQLAPRRGSHDRARQPRSRRLHLIGTAFTLGGAVLAVAGLVGIALLTADPTDPLFLYASRPVVLLVGLLLLTPAFVIVALGVLTRTFAEQAAEEGDRGVEE